MKLEHIVALAVRLFAIALAIYALRNGISLVPYFYEQGSHGSSYSYAAVMIVLLFVAVGLWYFPLTVTQNLVTFRGAGETDLSSASADQLQLAGFTILGLYLLFHVLSDVVYWGSIWFIVQRSSGPPIELSLDQKARMAATLIELIFVLFLLLGTRRIVDLLRKFRYGKDA